MLTGFLLSCLSLGQDLPTLGPTGDAHDLAILKAVGLPDDGPELVEHLRKRSADPRTLGRIRLALTRLSDDRFEIREEATLELVRLGPVCRAHLIEAAKDQDPEVADRARQCLEKIREWHSERVIGAVVRRLVAARPPGAEGALLGYLPSAEDVGCAEEVLEGLKVLARLPVTPGALAGALGDGEPMVRVAAARSLRAAGRELEATARLLADPSREVRLGLALDMAREADPGPAVPVLLDLMPGAPLAEGVAIEDALHTLAGNKGPEAAPWPGEPAGRARRREQWAAWAATRNRQAGALGRTLVVLLDQSMVQDLDARNEPIAELADLQFPLDAEPLPGGRVLLAEHAGNKVTVRNMRNQVLWEKSIEMPLAAQGLANGRVLVATADAIHEIDANGKEVRRLEFPGEKIMKCHRLATGETGLVLQEEMGTRTRFVRLDRHRRPMGQVLVQVKTSGGRIDWRANGHVLVPELEAQRVAEYDAAGKVVWEAPAELPVYAAWQPSGTVMVTSRNERGAVEIDRQGKAVWSYRIMTRVTRAIRH